MMSQMNGERIKHARTEWDEERESERASDTDTKAHINRHSIARIGIDTGECGVY